jgi:hypothetical protein
VHRPRFRRGQVDRPRARPAAAGNPAGAADRGAVEEAAEAAAPPAAEALVRVVRVRRSATSRLRSFIATRSAAPDEPWSIRSARPTGRS